MNTKAPKAPQQKPLAIEVNMFNDLPGSVVDLKKVFGVVDLNYRVKTENHEIVRIDGVTKNGLLCLSAGRFAYDGAEARIAIRASDDDGDSIFVMLRASILDHAHAARVA